MIKAITFIPARFLGGEITEHFEYASALVSARTLLKAVKLLDDQTRLTYVPKVEIFGVRHDTEKFHRIACCRYHHPNGCRTVAAASAVLAHVARELISS
jgi:hypothetical protein